MKPIIKTTIEKVKVGTRVIKYSRSKEVCAKCEIHLLHSWNYCPKCGEKIEREKKQ